MMTPEQMIAAQKANVESLFGLTEKAFAGVEKLVDLNMTAAKAALQDNLHQTQAFFNVKDIQELMALQAGYLQPMAEKAAAFNRHVYEIASSTGSEFTKAVEAKAAEAQKAVAGMVDSAAMIKSAVAASHTAMESVQKAVKQATEAAEANMHAMASNVTATATTTKPAARKR
jgi:phasin family protein